MTESAKLNGRKRTMKKKIKLDCGLSFLIVIHAMLAPKPSIAWSVTSAYGNSWFIVWFN